MAAALRRLRHATDEGTLRLLSNVKLFGEGVDVPALDAVVFMEPRDSQVDVVQAVGRVMRKSEETGKRFGYIVVPIPIEPGGDIAGALSEGETGYRSVGKVLRALQAHDGRLAEEPLRFVQAYGTKINGRGNGGGGDAVQVILDIEDVSPGLFAQVVAASGLGKPGLRTSQDIESAVRTSGRALDDADLAEDLAAALGLAVSQERGRIPVIAALLLANACLLHKRLSDLPGMEALPKLNGIGGASDPAGVLRDAWQEILDRDYAPVFEPALAVLNVLDARNGVAPPPRRRVVTNALLSLVECANRVADSLSELGYDHAGPLYHRILPSAKSEGAFYTKNLSALILARPALNRGFVDWSDAEAVANLRVIDPACGTGTLLMAALHVIKARAAEAQELDDEGVAVLHRRLVEDTLCGLDINRHAVQLAACNLTLGAPTVDYRRMNLLTLRNGPQQDGEVRSGSLEILTTVDEDDPLRRLRRPLRSLSGVRAEHVNQVEDPNFPLSQLDLVLMNPPFTSNDKRHRQFDKETVKCMQRHEMAIRDEVEAREGVLAGVIDANSIGTFFTPLAARLLGEDRGVLAIPRPTQFFSLRKMPTTPEEALAAADAIGSGRPSEWGQHCLWPAERVTSGDWTPCQWYDGSLAEVAREIVLSPLLEEVGLHHNVGPAGQRSRDSFRECDAGTPGSVRLFWSVDSKLRRLMRGTPESWRIAKSGKEHLAARYWRQRSQVLIAQKYRTTTGRLTALWTPEPSIGSGWVPVAVTEKCSAQALVAWWNATPTHLLLLNQRTKLLDYPSWSLAQLQRIPIPKPDNPGWQALSEAWRKACDMELLPLRDAEHCQARRIIDEAAALVLNVSPEEMTDWRRRLSAEPTITNRRATRD